MYLIKERAWSRWGGRLLATEATAMQMTRMAPTASAAAPAMRMSGMRQREIDQDRRQQRQEEHGGGGTPHA